MINNHTSKRKDTILVNRLDLGLKDYNKVWDLQKKLFNEVTEKRDNNYLIFTEHHPVITLGKSSDYKNIITSSNILDSKNIELVEIDRGGDVTFHGPGQIVAYPIFNLLFFKKDIHWYLRSLEEVIIKTLKKFGIKANRIDGLTGVWVDNQKICAIGIKVTRWVTMHGFALNVSTEMDYFNHIIPCGIQNKSVTSMQKILGNEILLTDVKTEIGKSFQTVFNIELEKREYEFTI